MNEDKIIELAFYTLPALITGGVAYYFFQMFVQNEEKRRRFQLMKENQKQALPLRLQAYERMTLFLERINPSKLLIRVAPNGNDKNSYESLLIQHIEQEFEHNLTQQLYLSNDCWTIIVTAKNTIIQIIRKTNMSDKIDSAHKLRETVLNDLLENESPSNVALNYLKNEIKEFL
jgi:hypothetical protein